MANKDQTIGAVIFLACLAIILGYIAFLFAPQLLIGLLGPMITLSATTVQFWLVAIPVLLAFVAVLAIGAWIGWTMATTPPPKPLDEINTEDTAEEEKPGSTEEKREE